MAGVRMVVRIRKSLSGRITVDTFGPYDKDTAERRRRQLEDWERERPYSGRGTIHVSEPEGRVRR